MNQSESSQVGVLASPLTIAEPLEDISNLGTGITDFEEAYTNEVSLLQNQQAILFAEVEI